MENNTNSRQLRYLPHNRERQQVRRYESNLRQRRHEEIVSAQRQLREYISSLSRAELQDLVNSLAENPNNGLLPGDIDSLLRIHRENSERDTDTQESLANVRNRINNINC